MITTNPVHCLQSNVLVGDNNQALLTDFGLSVLLEDTRTGLTTANSSAMSIRYFSPERLQGEDLNQKSDVYSFGCLALGEYEFSGE